jgi:propanol-preferring alcohol dehydrogenase
MPTETYRAVQVSALGQFQMVRRGITSPPPGKVRIRVEACGVCRSDAVTVLGLRPDISYPHVPGHEVVGKIDALGDGVSGWLVGQRVGVGYLGGPDFRCVHCRRGDFANCVQQDVTGITTDGGYAEVMFARESGLVAVPDEISPQDAAPLVCAGVTTYNALRSFARPGDLVAVQGIGGVGHLAIQFARAMALRVVAIGRSAAKEQLALALGAHTYIDTQAIDPAAALRARGGAAVILATAPSNRATERLVGGLAPRGTLVILGVGGDGPMLISPGDLVSGARAIVGTLTGTTIETADALAFSVGHDVRPMVETIPLELAADAYSRMIQGAARFRMVLVTGA